MESTEYFTRELYTVLSDITHPIEGIFYLILLALVFRWRWPLAWNNFLKSIAAKTKLNTSFEEIHSENSNSFCENDSVESKEQSDKNNL